ncbi:MAG: 3-isopropylmalate dehydratase [Deltaproteobacteria bacterium]|nr:3-isopropylmalate dehydratase [Deltaproteobacteria bacterium]
MREDRLTFRPRILYLTEDPALLRRQLDGEQLPWDPDLPLLDSISTDELTPGWVCYYYDEKLGEYCLVGLRGGVVRRHDIARARPDVIVSGRSKGCGSSRETAPFAEKCAGVRLVIARSIEKIYGQNCHNIGLLTSTDMGLVGRIERGEPIAIEEFTRDLDPISADIVRYGGLFEYSKARLEGRASAPPIQTPARPMNVVEKILARHAVTDLQNDARGLPAVRPGDALFARADVRFSHEYVTPMAEALFRQAFGPDARVAEPSSVFTFRDHLTFLEKVMSEEHRQMGLLEAAKGLADTQEEFARTQGLKLYGEAAAGGSEAICHNAVIEDLAEPGQVVAGTDSHTCMAGVLGCFAFGVGSTDMANAWFTRDVRVRVPETVRFALHGRLGDDVCAKDVILHILSRPFFKEGKGIGKVLEIGGEAIRAMPLDERATLTNMAVEAGGFTGIVVADDLVVEQLVRSRGLDPVRLRSQIVRPDPDAEYFATFEIDLGRIVPMVALPGDPRNGVPLSELGGDVAIDIAYGGSCTGGKMADMDMYSRVFARALQKGLKVPPSVQCIVQFGSQKIRRYAESKGYVEIFEGVGAQVIDPSCGACIKAGPGASSRAEQITVSAQNRNFPGRSGPGRVFLASPLVVAASAIAGRIVSPETLLGRAGP